MSELDRVQEKYIRKGILMGRLMKNIKLVILNDNTYHFDHITLQEGHHGSVLDVVMAKSNLIKWPSDFEDIDYTGLASLIWLNGKALPNLERIVKDNDTLTIMKPLDIPRGEDIYGARLDDYLAKEQLSEFYHF